MVYGGGMGTVRTLHAVPALAAGDDPEAGAPGPQTTDPAPLRIATGTYSICAPADVFGLTRKMVDRISFHGAVKKWAVWGAMLSFCLKNEKEFQIHMAEYLSADNVKSA